MTGVPKRFLSMSKDSKGPASTYSPYFYYAFYTT